METLTGWLLILGLLGGYFVPWICAASRQHRQTVAIFVLNLLLGWTFVGWVAALVWACTNPVQEAA